MIKANKNQLIIGAFLVSIFVAIVYLYGILIPFFLGLAMVFWVSPLINRICKLVKNRMLANTLFLATLVGLAVLLLALSANFINTDFRRLNNSVKVVLNSEKLSKSSEKIKNYISAFYDLENLEKNLKTHADSLINEAKNIDPSTINTDAISEALDQIKGYLPVDENEMVTTTPFDTWFMFSSFFLYFILILYNFEYFDSLRNRYFNSKFEGLYTTMISDFNKSFIHYFNLRTKIISILIILYLICFIALKIPGIILITILIFVLSYVPYLQYVMLLPLSIGCLVLSIENEQSFFLYFGIIVGVFMLASVLEEVVLNPKIMEYNIGMNPVIMVLALSIWGYILGWVGVVIAIPLTSLLIIYFKRFVVTSIEEENLKKE